MADNDVLMGVIADKDHELAALREENATLEAKLARCVEALEPFIRRHCGLCVPVDERGRMGEVTTESCVCDADQKQARAALAAAKGESDGA